jgi:hypothetical protein
MEGLKIAKQFGITRSTFLLHRRKEYNRLEIRVTSE